MKVYMKPQLEYIELAVSEQISAKLCYIDGDYYDGICPS